VVGKLGPLEWVLNTPSQHRVHHGKNAYCIDKNYGGTLCIFDRLFGTFQEELDQVNPSILECVQADPCWPSHCLLAGE
jgi:alkylglycerol monooxygenase